MKNIMEIAEELLAIPDVAIAIFENSPDAIVIVTEKGKIRLVNRQAEFLSGYHRSEMRDQPIELLLPDGKKEAHAHHREMYLKEPKLRPMGVGLDLHIKRKDGETVPVEINLSPISTTFGLLIIAVIRRKNGSK